MSIIADAFSGLLANADNIIDEIVTSKEEKMQLKNEMQKMLLDSEANMQENVTERWKADMNSDSYLSKNVRPLVLIFLVVTTVLLVFIDAGFIQFEVKDNWVNLLELVLITVIGAYFGGRSIEKVRGTSKPKKELVNKEDLSIKELRQEIRKKRLLNKIQD
tara:strand:+ start:106 stop:588 length:483 start_codon:yes stop_codon:yes gene_type:complete